MSSRRAAHALLPHPRQSPSAAAPPGPARPPHRSPWRRRLLAVLAGVLVGGALAEALVVLVAGEQPKFPRHVVRAPWGLRYNEPGARYWHRSADLAIEFRINAQGMRSDHDAAYRKPPGVRRIVSLGDSFTIGYEVDVADCFSSVLERELRRAGHHVEVLNAGVSGFSTAEELLYLERELLRYDPDLILISFYGNDPEDNLRTGLFAVRDGVLHPGADEYVPGGVLADVLNTNPLLALLSERSNALAFAKEGLTSAVKRRLDRTGRRAAPGGAPPREAAATLAPATELTVALYERLYAVARARDLPLVIHSIPSRADPGTGEPPLLVEQFPLEHFAVDRPGLHFVPAKAVLEPSRGTDLLYWTRSHGHWTPFSHAAAGRDLAARILAAELLP